MTTCPTNPRIDFIELWFQIIVGEETQSDDQHTLFNLSSIHIESAPDLMVQVSMCSIVKEFIPQIISMLNGSIGNIPTP
jgi:hypothetical protein